MGAVRHKLVDGSIKTYRKIIAHTFEIYDFADHEAAVRDACYSWSKSPAGKFILDKCEPDSFNLHNFVCFENLSRKYAIEVEIDEITLTEYYLKFDTKFE